ncbi:MAG: SUMF1/EgtB/PvdO family nonheme iron enzyme [Treponema sp.]|nr:SUMF1/EgtB/PvdO family nonheme iron enzyme [Treponema sp.]
MKSLIKSLGIIAVLAVIGLAFGSCDDDISTLTGTVVITGNAQVGQTLTANTDDLDGSGTISYQWRRGSAGIGTNSSTYTVQSADVGSAITVTVTRNNYTGNVSSEPTAIVVGLNAPTAGLAFTLINNGTAYSVSKGTATVTAVIIPAVHEGRPVTEIADSGFTSYTNMMSIVIPVGVTRIGSYAFFQCSNLTDIVVPAGLTSVGNFAFSDCSSLNRIFYGGADNIAWNGIMIGSNNSLFTNANRFYYSETDPGEINTHWYFINSMPSVWVKVDPIVTWPTNLSAAYGQRLSNITLPGDGTSNQEGAFTWVTPTALVGNPGEQTHNLRFTPTNTVNYNTLAQNVNITVNKTDPVVTWPTNLSATHGQMLSDVILPGNGTSNPAGSFTWVTPTALVGNVGTQTHSLRFTPTDTVNYNSLTQNVSIIVKANPVVTWPTNLSANNDQRLSDILLPGNGTSNQEGAFTWVTPTASVGNPGTQTHSLRFTPTDTVHYNTLTQNVNITVNKVDLLVTWPTYLCAIYGQTLSNVMLPGNGTSNLAGTFTWVTPTASVGNVGTRMHSLRFTPTDTVNYNTVTQNVNILVVEVEIEMVFIPSGTFRMGSPSTEAGHFSSEDYRTENIGNVTVSGFWMGRYQVTQEQYQAVTGNNPSYFHGGSGRAPAAGEIQIKRPVESVTWYDAIEFCNRLSIIEGLTPVYTITGRTPAIGYPIINATVTANWDNDGYRLPTEAEWEYACRAGTNTRWYFGETESNLVNYAWYNANSGSRTHQVGLKLPNAWGLYDMHGNVWEWCWVWYTSSYNSAGGNNNPKGAVSGTRRVTRGGSWINSASNTRSAYRGISYYPDYRDFNFGFRLVRP